MRAKARNGFDHLRHLRCRDKPRAFKLPRRVGVARAPQEILVIEGELRIVPTGVAGVPIDDPIRGRKFRGGMAEARDHHDGTAGSPSKPREATRKADEQRGMFEEARRLNERPARLVFGTDSSFFPRGWNAPVFEAQTRALQDLGTGTAEACPAPRSSAREVVQIVAPVFLSSATMVFLSPPGVQIT